MLNKNCDKRASTLLTIRESFCQTFCVFWPRDTFCKLNNSFESIFSLFQVTCNPMSDYCIGNPNIHYHHLSNPLHWMQIRMTKDRTLSTICTTRLIDVTLTRAPCQLVVFVGIETLASVCRNILSLYRYVD